MASQAHPILDKEHGDITYLKQDEIGLVLSKALSETYKAQPNDPVDFFAKFLLNHTRTAKKAKEEKEAEKVVKDMRDKHLAQLKQKEHEENEKKKKLKDREDKMARFFEGLTAPGTEDLRDKLDELAHFLQEYTGPSTGVYIGKLEHPRKPISDMDNDTAHVDKEAPRLIRFMYASNGHEFMKGKLLRADQGISHRVFSDSQANAQEGEEVPADEGAEEGENKPAAKQVGDPTDILNTYKHLYIKEVVREPAMHFYRVPRLGAFMVVPLDYESCLSAKALDQAVADMANVKKLKEEQDKERAEWEEEQAKLREEKEKNGEPWEPENKDWPVIAAQPFVAKKKRYVVCLDTLGQDRDFTDDQRRFVLKTISEFRAIWEDKERANLRVDIERRLQQLDHERDFIDSGDNVKLQEEEDRFVDDELNKREQKDDSQPFADEDQKELFVKGLRIQFLARLFKDKEDWRKGLLSLAKATVLKLPRVLQSVFYLLQFKREDICQPGSNKFFWKQAKKHFNELFIEKLVAYNPSGVKLDKQNAYTTLNFLEKNLEGIALEEVEAQCGLELARLYRWLTLCVKTRRDDILYRKAQRQRALSNRESLQKREAERLARLDVEVAEAEAKFAEEHKEEIEAAQKWDTEQNTQQVEDEYGEEDDEDEKAPVKEEEKPKEKPVVPVFNRDEFLKRWLEENPKIEIPEEGDEVQDADWHINPEELQALLQAFLSKDQN